MNFILINWVLDFVVRNLNDVLKHFATMMSSVGLGLLGLSVFKPYVEERGGLLENIAEGPAITGLVVCALSVAVLCLQK